jgi:hypothetical protein
MLNGRLSIGTYYTVTQPRLPSSDEVSIPKNNKDLQSRLKYAMLLCNAHEPPAGLDIFFLLLVL